MVGNLVGWKHGERMHEVLRYQHNRFSPAQNKMQRLRMQQSFAFVLLGSFHLSPCGAKERLCSLLCIVPLVCFFIPSKSLVDNKYSRDALKNFERILLLP
jgi:hypothetical protein